MAALDDLKTAHAAACAEMAALVASKPDYSLDGQSVQWSAYRKELQDRIDKLWEMIIKQSGPASARSRGRS